MKKIIAILMALVLLLAACALAESEIAEDWNFPDEADTETWNPDEDEVPGWEINDLDSAKGGEALKELFDKAVEGLTGVTCPPAAVLGTQVVSGNNYCILCHCDYTDSDVKDTGWALVYINEAFGGEVQVTNVVDLDLEALSDYGILH